MEPCVSSRRRSRLTPQVLSGHVACFVAPLVAAAIGCAPNNPAQPELEGVKREIQGQTDWFSLSTAPFDFQELAGCRDGSLYGVSPWGDLFYSTQAGLAGTWSFVTEIGEGAHIACYDQLYFLYAGNIYQNTGTPTAVNPTLAAKVTNGVVNGFAVTQSNEILVELIDGSIARIDPGRDFSNNLTWQYPIVGHTPRDITVASFGLASAASETNFASLYALASNGDLYWGSGYDYDWSLVGHRDGLFFVSANLADPDGVYGLVINSSDRTILYGSSNPAGALYSNIFPTTPVAVFDYYMPERDPDDPLGLAPPTYAPETLDVVLDGCGSSGHGSPLTTYRWDIYTPDLQTFSGPGCGALYTFPQQGTFPVVLTVTDTLGRTNQTKRYVSVRNYVVVAMGDSIASGEGNPDEPWNFTWTGSINPGIWEDRVCHRSHFSGLAQASRYTEVSDPHSSITFMSTACSGAGIENGILTSYAGEEPNAGATPLPSQLDQVRTALCAAKPGGVCPTLDDVPNIDALMIVVGANDANFAGLVTDCANPLTDCTSDDVGYAAIKGIAALPTLYGGMHTSLSQNLRFAHAYLGEYPDPLRNDSGNLCSQIVFSGAGDDDAGPFAIFYHDATIDGGKISWASNVIVNPLNGGFIGGNNLPYSKWSRVGGIASAFQTHGYCADDHWIIHYDESKSIEATQDGHLSPDGTMHPNQAGQRVYTEQFGMALRKAIANPRETAIWKRSSEPENAFFGISEADMLNQIQPLGAQGWRLKLLKGYSTNDGQNYYNAVWYQSPTVQKITVGRAVGVPRDGFVTAVQANLAQGWRITDLQMWTNPSGTLLYNAVYEQTSGIAQRIFVCTPDDGSGLCAQGCLTFASDGTCTSSVGGNPDPTPLYNSGWAVQLHDCARDEGQDSTQCVTIWEQGAKQQVHQHWLTAPQLDAAIRTQRSQGWVPVMIDSSLALENFTYINSGSGIGYSVIFESSVDDEKTVYGLRDEAFRARYDAMRANGWGLVSLDTTMY